MTRRLIGAKIPNSDPTTDSDYNLDSSTLTGSLGGHRLSLGPLAHVPER